jgi:hypothetical protein
MTYLGSRQADMQRISALTVAADYSSTIALMGHCSAQEPQEAHLSWSMTYWVSPWEIASQGHWSAQEPQEMQASVIL